MTDAGDTDSFAIEVDPKRGPKLEPLRKAAEKSVEQVPGVLSVTAVLTALCLGLTTTAVTAVSSVVFPMRVNLDAKTSRGSFSTGGSCLTGIAVTFLVPPGVAIVGLPAMVPLALAVWQERPLWGVLGLPLAWLYGLVLFWYSTRFAGELLAERESEVWAALKPPEHNE